MSKTKKRRDKQPADSAVSPWASTVLAYWQSVDPAQCERITSGLANVHKVSTLNDKLLVLHGALSILRMPVSVQMTLILVLGATQDPSSLDVAADRIAAVL